jgi:hypothetical protein
MLVRPTTIIMSTTAPDDTSRETELIFTDGCGLDDGFAASGLGAVLVGAGALLVAAAATEIEGVPEDPLWLTAAAATPGEPFVGLQGTCQSETEIQ